MFKRFLPNSVNSFKTAFFLVFFISVFSGFAQFNSMPIGGIDTGSTCTGIILDPGGTGNYGNATFSIYTINPNGNSTVSLVFSQFSTQANQDFLKVYDGASVNGTLLGNFSGNSLPNGGNAITSLSGSMTLVFTSNIAMTSSGFVASWSTNDTTSPTSQFVTSTNSVAFNTPLQFLNTSVNSNARVWDFGDGTTSTDYSPFHTYTSSGVKQVKLISSNCFGSDTSSVVNITVLPSPNGTFSLDTIALTVPCNGKDSTTIVLNNTGLGDLPYNIEFSGAQPNVLIDAKFEGPGFDGFVNQNPNLYTATIVSTAATPQGSSHLRFAGDGTVIRDGLVRNIPNSQPTEISYFVKAKTTVTGNSHGYVLFRSNLSTGGNMFFSSFRYGLLRCSFSKNGAYSMYTKNVVAGQWIKIELKEIDFTNNSFDLYVDGVKVENDIQFYHNNVTDIDAVHMYHIWQGSFGIDDFQVIDANVPNAIEYYPKTSVVSANGSQTITIVGDGNALPIGEYWYDFTVESNDTNLDGKIIPLKLIVEGRGELEQDTMVVDAGTVYTNTTFHDSVKITNVGCDTLLFDSITNALPNLTVSPSSMMLLPDSTNYVHFNFTSPSSGVFNDTARLFGTDTSSAIYFSANVIDAPNLVVNPSNLFYNVNGCDSIVINDTLQLLNSGLGMLNYTLNLLTSYRDTSFQNYTTSGAATNHTFTNVPTTADSLEITVVLKGDFDLTSEYAFMNIDSYTYGIVPDNNTNNYDTIRIKLTNSTLINNWLANGSINVQLTNSNSVGFISSFGNSHEVILSVYNNQWVSTSAMSPSSLSGNDSIDVPLFIDASSLPDGFHTAYLEINSNDPAQPEVIVTIELNKVSYPDLKLSANCINYGTVQLNQTYSDSILMKNEGCADLFFNGYFFNDPNFTTAYGTPMISPGDSAWLVVNYTPTTTGTINSFVLLDNNDTNIAVCLNALVSAAPIATYDHANTNTCDGIFSFTDNSTNIPTQWFWDFGDGNFSIAQNPSHTYKYPGVYQVKMVATNVLGSDSLTKTINALDILYADFVMPQTTNINQSVQFIDSSQTATAWQWFFGDGNTSTLKNPTNIYTSGGTYNVSLIVTTATCTKTVNKQIVISGNIGLEEFNLHQISVYPNPAKDELTIELPEIIESANFELYNGLGQNLSIDKNLHEGSNKIDVSNLKDGIYYLRINTDSGNTINQKVTIKH